MSPDIPERESLTVEFKSDRNRLNDRDLIAAVVCLANTDGGDLYLGIEDDGTVTGLHSAHQNLTGLTALIANLTSPPLTIRVEAMNVESRRIARISVPKSRQLVATSDGFMQRRRLKADGLPECVPFYPHEFAQRQSDLGLLDYSACRSRQHPKDFDPLERERLRQCIERYGGDRSLIGLADDELDGALGLIRRDEGRIVPTVAGLLILGREAALREHLPTHEVDFPGSGWHPGSCQRLLPDAPTQDVRARRGTISGTRRRKRDPVLRIVIEEKNRLGSRFPVHSIITLVLLRHERRVDTNRPHPAQIQRDEYSRVQSPGTAGRRPAGRRPTGSRKGELIRSAPRFTNRSASRPIMYGKPASTRSSKSKWSSSSPGTMVESRGRTR